MNRLKLFIPVFIFIILGAFFWQSLGKNTTALPSALVGKPFPNFSLPSLQNSEKVITKKDLLGEYALINVWATWCPNCRIEHPFFMQLAKQGVTIIGLNWRDPEQEEAKNWLTKLGNPYSLVIADVDNRLGLDLGVYGAPETFLIDPNGVIIHKQVGIVSAREWTKDFLPKMKPGAASE